MRAANRSGVNTLGRWDENPFSSLLLAGIRSRAFVGRDSCLEGCEKGFSHQRTSGLCN
jgi:hypothetical protein